MKIKLVINKAILGLEKFTSKDNNRSSLQGVLVEFKKDYTGKPASVLYTATCGSMLQTIEVDQQIKDCPADRVFLPASVLRSVKLKNGQTGVLELDIGENTADAQKLGIALVKSKLSVFVSNALTPKAVIEDLATLENKPIAGMPINTTNHVWDNTDYSFPDYKQVIPKSTGKLESIAVCMDLLKVVSQYYGSFMGKGANRVLISFVDDLSPITIVPKSYRKKGTGYEHLGLVPSLIEAKSVVMPCRV